MAQTRGALPPASRPEAQLRFAHRLLRYDASRLLQVELLRRMRDDVLVLLLSLLRVALVPAIRPRHAAYSAGAAQKDVQDRGEPRGSLTRQSAAV